MDEKEKVDYYEKYPVLRVIVPVLGGFFAWYFSGVLLIGLFVCIGGLLLIRFNKKQ